MKPAPRLYANDRIDGNSVPKLPDGLLTEAQEVGGHGLSGWWLLPLMVLGLVFWVTLVLTML